MEYTTSSFGNDKLARNTALRIGIGLTLFIFFNTAFTHAMQFIFHTSIGNPILSYVIPYVLVYGLGFLVFWLVTRSISKTKLPVENWKFGRLCICFFISYGGGLLFNYIYSVIKSLCSSSSVSTMTTEAISDMMSVSPILAFVVMVIVAPVVEELVFRKTIIDSTKKFGEKNAIVFSALCFGMFHMNIQQVIYAFIIGLVFGYVYSRTGRIYYTMMMHSVNNLIGFLTAYLYAGVQKALSGLNLSDLSSFLNSITTEQQELISQAAPWIFLQYAVMIATFAMAVLGIIFFFVRGRKVRFTKDAENQIKNIVPLILNIGVILFFVVCLVFVALRIASGNL